MTVALAPPVGSGLPTFTLKPGYWLVEGKTGVAGVLHVTKTTKTNAVVSAANLGTKPTTSGLEAAINRSGLLGLMEYSGGLSALLSNAKAHGIALQSQTPGVQGTNDLIAAAVADTGAGTVYESLTDTGSSLYDLLTGESGNAQSSTSQLGENTSGDTTPDTTDNSDNSDNNSEDDSAKESAAKTVSAATTAAPSWLADLEKWLASIGLRILEVVGGVLLLAFGLHSLLGGPSPTTIIQKVRP